VEVSLRLRSAVAVLLALAVPAPAFAQEVAPSAPAPEIAPSAPAPEIAPAAPTPSAPEVAPAPAPPPAPPGLPSQFTAPGLPSQFTAPGAAPPPPPAPGLITFATPVEPVRDVVVEQGPRRQGDVHFDLGFGTELPISVGGVGTLELPGRLLLQLGLGFMPHGYAYAIDGILTSVGAYDQTVSALIRSALGNSFVLKASAGWRPFEGHGLEILGGYTLVTMGGTTTASDVINAGLAESGSSQRVGSSMSQDLPLGATLHNVHVTLGWRWLMADDHLVVRASLSYVQCLASSMSVGLPAAQQAMEPSVNQALNASVGPYLTHYVKAPTLGLSMAYRF
jgi:hypothetical protein